MSKTINEAVDLVAMPGAVMLVTDTESIAITPKVAIALSKNLETFAFFAMSYHLMRDLEPEYELKQQAVITDEGLEHGPIN